MQNPNDNGLLGSQLLSIPADILEHEVYEQYAQAGYGEVRLMHSAILRYLPPEGCRVTDLARQARMTKQAAGYIVDSLVQHGYIERVSDPADGRAQIVRRTAKGWELHRLARHVVQQVLEEWTRVYGEENMQQLLSLLQDLVHRVLGIPYQGGISVRSPGEQPEDPAEGG
ncbi:MarR family winged helix-turn-helix transcriptional regulator [Ktedonobacter racemifer]|uniref:Transcriptional regulator, MarR family n=1 Tax=Ktedonobacter racemifer DSM 44963 TaxID=485913 RepID=D6U455_KTERA|nr:MarR family winged helix-turn-helix transcriptional regulator [Ktedonobacter racemifer]EFH81285.1 transcriptional regulator, MarR family [Ktedonobacter racemifer DSM 44963]